MKILTQEDMVRDATRRLLGAHEVHHFGRHIVEFIGLEMKCVWCGEMISKEDVKMNRAAWVENPDWLLTNRDFVRCDGKEPGEA